MNPQPGKGRLRVARARRPGRILFAALTITGALLMLSGIWWGAEYARGEWAGELGRLEYARANAWLLLKGPAAMFGGMLASIVGWLGWSVSPAVGEDPLYPGADRRPASPVSGGWENS